MDDEAPGSVPGAAAEPAATAGRSAGSPSRGADLAREALVNARASTAARRKAAGRTPLGQRG
ncbi:MAG TPA: hypothetical protein VII33_01645, partial [Nakamurella sp.]